MLFVCMSQLFGVDTIMGDWVFEANSKDNIYDGQ